MLFGSDFVRTSKTETKRGGLTVRYTTFNAIKMTRRETERYWEQKFTILCRDMAIAIGISIYQ